MVQFLSRKVGVGLQTPFSSDCLRLCVFEQQAGCGWAPSARRHFMRDEDEVDDVTWRLQTLRRSAALTVCVCVCFNKEALYEAQTVPRQSRLSLRLRSSSGL